MNNGKLYTSYFAKLNKGIGIKISIARYNPKWLKKGDMDFWFQSLSPSKELLYFWKNKDNFSNIIKTNMIIRKWFLNICEKTNRNIDMNNITWKDYEVIYKKEISEHMLYGDMRALLNLLDSGRDVTVYCYEKPIDNCHRHILGDIIKGLGYEVKEVE